MWAGVLNVDKPAGLTSHDVVNQLRRVSRVRRIGHAGTLDPLATGVLVVCVGWATRLVEYLVGLPKVYVTTVRLGQQTETYDAEGRVVVERPFSHLTPEHITTALGNFRGLIQQQPPAYSAIKQHGRPLYELARQGMAVERPWREVMIMHLEMTAWSPPDLSLTIHCSSGTYVRSLAHDLGEMLGCGGHVRTLRRLAVGEFEVETAVSLSSLTLDTFPHWLQPPDLAVAHLPRLDLPATAVAALGQGKRLPRYADQPMVDLARAYGPEGDFIGMVRAEGETWQPQKIFTGMTTNL